MALPVVAVTNVSTVLTDAEVAAVLPALQRHVSQDLKAYWDVDCQLIQTGKDAVLVDGWWQMLIVDNPDLAGALGYHELNARGGPLMKVFAGLDIAVGTKWTVTASHELDETLIDPWCNACMQGNNQRIYALEIADPVEADSLGYEIDGVLVSDFITPAWYEITSADRLDFKQRLKQRFEIAPGGYIAIWDGTNWNQVDARTIDMPPLLANERVIPPVGSRRHKRNIPRAQWQRSLQ